MKSSPRKIRFASGKEHRLIRNEVELVDIIFFNPDNLRPINFLIFTKEELNTLRANFVVAELALP